MTLPHPQATPKPLSKSAQTRFLYAVIAAASAAVAYVAFGEFSAERGAVAAPSAGRQLEDIPFDGQQAYEYLKHICDFGPRPSGSRGMQQQQEYLQQYFEKLGAKVTRQTFQVAHPKDGQAVELCNLLVSWHPERKQRILLGTHYDTRPYADQDPIDPTAPVLGANDGASGVALLMELGPQMKALRGKLGVDFVFFDAEEFVFNERDPYFLGSGHFAEQYVAHPPGHKYVAGVVLDMIGDRELAIYQEGNSIDWHPSRSIVSAIWATAARLRVTEFIPRLGPTVNDDHVPLQRVARIPTCDIIDFGYPTPGIDGGGGEYWHTRADTPDKCSALSLARVGWVISEWLKKAVAQ